MMATRQEHLAKAERLAEDAAKAEHSGRTAEAQRLNQAAQTRIQLAEAKRPTRPTFGTTRIRRGR